MCLLALFSIGDWKDISKAHVIIIIKSEVSTFPIVIIFFRGCVPKMFVTSYPVTYCIYIPGKPGICFHYYCAVYDECKESDTFWLADRIRLSVHYTISLSSLCKLIWRHWTYKMPVRYILSSVWVRLSIFSQISIIQYMRLCVFSLPISLVMIERIYTFCLIIIIINSEVWTITHCLGLGLESMVCAVCLYIFLFFWWTINCLMMKISWLMSVMGTLLLLEVISLGRFQIYLVVLNILWKGIMSRVLYLRRLMLMKLEDNMRWSKLVLQDKTISQPVIFKHVLDVPVCPLTHIWHSLFINNILHVNWNVLNHTILKIRGCYIDNIQSTYLAIIYTEQKRNVHWQGQCMDCIWSKDFFLECGKALDTAHHTIVLKTISLWNWRYCW